MNEKYTLKGKLADFMATGVYHKLFDSDDADRATVDRMAKDNPVGDTAPKSILLKKLTSPFLAPTVEVKDGATNARGVVGTSKRMILVTGTVQ